MDPTTIFCPNLACPARGQVGQGNISIHSRQEQRFVCKQCHKTFTATKGTVFYRLRTSAELVVTVVTLLAHGCPLQAIVAAFRLDERTVAAWWARAGQQGQAVQEYLVEQPRDLGHVQADEIRVKTQGDIVWMALACRAAGGGAVWWRVPPPTSPCRGRCLRGRPAGPPTAPSYFVQTACAPIYGRFARLFVIPCRQAGRGALGCVAGATSVWRRS
jgi:transposase-like protein